MKDVVFFFFNTIKKAHENDIKIYIYFLSHMKKHVTLYRHQEFPAIEISVHTKFTLVLFFFFFFFNKIMTLLSWFDCNQINYEFERR
jgi:hypothetical protein